MALGFQASPKVPRATSAIVQLVALVVLTGLLFGAVCVTVIGGAYMAILNFAH